MLRKDRVSIAEREIAGKSYQGDFDYAWSRYDKQGDNTLGDDLDRFDDENIDNDGNVKTFTKSKDETEIGEYEY